MNVDPRDFLLEYSGLELTNYRDVGLGVCQCSLRSEPLIHKGTMTACKACVLLRQAYPESGGQRPLRLGMGSYLFVTPERVEFWGRHKLNEINPQIVCRPAAGQMAKVFRSLICEPPPPPWMFICFAASTSASMLRITYDTDVIRFSGVYAIGSTPIESIDRRQVMPWLAAKVPQKTLDTYFDAAHRSAAADIATMRRLEEGYPELGAIRCLPAKSSAEHVVLRWLMHEAAA